MARRAKSQHLMQPVVMDEGNTARFKQNTIVRFLLDWSTERGMSLNDLGVMSFPREDRVQFAQLIGYSVSGFSDLSYVSEAEANKAWAAVEDAERI